MPKYTPCFLFCGFPKGLKVRSKFRSHIVNVITWIVKSASHSYSCKYDKWAINLNLIPPCYVVCTDPVGGILFPWVPPSLTCFYSQFSEWSLSVGSQLTWKGGKREIKVKFDCRMSRNKREKESELIPTEVFRTRAYCNKRVLLASTFDKIVCPPAQPACCDSQESLRTFVFSSPDSHLF